MLHSKKGKDEKEENCLKGFYLFKSLELDL